MAGQPSSFGKRKEPHTLIIAHGERVRHFTIRPWLAGLLTSTVITLSLGYLGATSYLMLRDTVLSTSAERQTRIQQAYEERIATLRVQLDRITSRQMLDQQLIETRVAELAERQSRLSQQQSQLLPVVERAQREIGGNLPLHVPVPAKRQEETPPKMTGSIQHMEKPITAAMAGLSPFASWTTRTGDAPTSTTMADAASSAANLLVSIEQSLKTVENRQLTHIAQLTDAALHNADAISDVLEAAGLPGKPAFRQADSVDSHMGGPLIPVKSTTSFNDRLQELDKALQTLSQIRQETHRLPLAHPVPGQKVTSLFGVRRDPLIGASAFHSGMDFRASIGTNAKASASGTIVSAGWNGGYGRMVEIDHGNGLSSRYAHLSHITVSVGQTVKAGELVGYTGNSGRSTGPHLHYEILRNGQALNPIRFLKAGKAVQQYL
ncbi:M23 family metallopeptidase [Aquamicrobium segne]|uniref:M23 family metallopeptidase n=1 Tax=Aquamicrobium segne TaxID=469547 RepID=A0ABW0GXX8_9HYPH